MQKLGDIESLTGQGFRSRSIAHSSIGSHRDESRRLSRLTPPHRASHEVRDVDCRRRHRRSCPAPCSRRVQTTRAGTQRGRAGTRAGAERLAQPVLPHRCCPTIPASRQACTEPPAPRTRAPSRAAALQRIGRFCADGYASASQPARSAPTLPTACANSARVAVLLPRSRAPPWGRPRRVVQTPTGALPFATGRLPHAATGSHL